MTEDDLKTFTERVRVEKCGGEITECKLAGFISNYNKHVKRFTIYIEGNNIIAVDMLFRTEKHFPFNGNKIIAMLTVMLYAVEKAQMVIFTWWTNSTKRFRPY